MAKESQFTTGVKDNTNFSGDACAAVLAHAVQNQTEAGLPKKRLFDQRRDLLMENICSVSFLVPIHMAKHCAFYPYEKEMLIKPT